MSDLGVNGFKNFGRNKAKQFVACNYDGYFVGDAILFAFEDDEFSLVGRPVAPNCAAFHAENGDCRVTVTRDERSVANDGRRLTFRFQLNGPATHKIVEKAVGGPSHGGWAAAGREVAGSRGAPPRRSGGADQVVCRSPYGVVGLLQHLG